MGPYDDALQEILDNGVEKKDRTGVGCVGVAGLSKKYRLDTGYFPLVTGRKLFPKAVFAELLWIISGSTRNEDLVALGAKFWSSWCDEKNEKYVALRKRWGYEPGDFGPIYGWQLRNFGGDYQHFRAAEQRLRHLEEHPETVLKGPEELRKGYAFVRDKAKGFDQLAYMVDILKTDPFGSNGRRCLFSLWNPNDLEKSALPPCHYTYQCVVGGDRKLTGILTQRSCDFPVGVPANIQFYSALTIMLAQQADMEAVEFIHNTSDSHIYLNQIEQVKEYLARAKPTSPKLTINKAADIFSYQPSDFVLTGYSPLDRIDMPVAV